jgi:hypothetical protein
MGILFTILMGIPLTITMGILFTMVVGIQFTVSNIPEDEANVVAGVVWQLTSLLYEKPLAESRGLLESVETEQERMGREAIEWLTDIPKKKNKPEGEIDLEELERELREGLEEEIKSEI